jgi:hypothetical protein
MTTARLERPRPKTIVVVTTFLFAATIVAFITGESLLFPNALLDYMWKFNPQGAALFHSIGRVSGVFLLALGVGTFFAALGLLRGLRWAWWFGVFLFGIESCGNVVSYFLTHDALRSGAGRHHRHNILTVSMPPGGAELFSAPGAHAKP